MEKLIELLNEYEGFKEDEFESWRIDEYGHLTEGGDYMRIGTNAKIISKQYGFIKWLVENDKIDRDKVKRESRKLFVGDLRPRTPRYKLLILLSISDTPIEDLISYLK